MIIFLLRYWYAFVVSGCTALFFLLLDEPYESRMSIVLLFAGFVACISFLYWLVYRSHRYRFVIGWTVLLFTLGATGVYTLIEDTIIRWIVLVVGSLLVGAIFYIPQWFSAQLAHEYKPWRRMFASIIALSTYGIIASLYGFDTFFQAPAFIWYAITGTVISGLLAYATLRLYYPVHTRRMLIWTLVIGGVSFELLWVLSALSLGYFMLALLFSWLWYVLTVLVRFHLSPKGILWNKQYFFLISNSIGMVLIMALAKWL